MEIETLKRCAPLWHEACFEVKSVKNYCFGAILEVELYHYHYRYCYYSYSYSYSYSYYDGDYY